VNKISPIDFVGRIELEDTSLSSCSRFTNDTVAGRILSADNRCDASAIPATMTTAVAGTATEEVVFAFATNENFITPSPVLTFTNKATAQH
jgi:hypothetical protein